MAIIKTSKFISASALGAILCTLAIGCSPEDFGSGNGLGDPNVDASFTVTPVEGSANRFVVNGNTDYVISHEWNIGNGFYKGADKDTIFFPDAGTYEVSHRSTGRGGLTNVSSQEVTVATNDPVAGNMVQGGKFENEDDYSKWTILNITPTGSQWTFNEGSATLTSTEAWSQQGIYQAIEVEKDRVYTIDMKITGGANVETWFEVYAGTTPPVQGVEYTDNKIMGISTWDGCGLEPFSGLLSTEGCVKNTNTDSVSNQVSFDTSGTIYLVIRSGGNVVDPIGFTITNVEFRGS